MSGDSDTVETAPQSIDDIVNGVNPKNTFADAERKKVEKDARNAEKRMERAANPSHLAEHGLKYAAGIVIGSALTAWKMSGQDAPTADQQTIARLEQTIADMRQANADSAQASAALARDNARTAAHQGALDAKDEQIEELRKELSQQGAEYARKPGYLPSALRDTLITDGATLTMPAAKFASMTSGSAVNHLKHYGELMATGNEIGVISLSRDPLYANGKVFAVTNERLTQVNGGPEAITRAFQAVIAAPSYSDRSKAATYAAVPVFNGSGDITHVKIQEDIGSDGVDIVDLGPQVEIR